MMKLVDRIAYCNNASMLYDICVICVSTKNGT